jgi:hypothetical protein
MGSHVPRGIGVTITSLVVQDQQEEAKQRSATVLPKVTKPLQTQPSSRSCKFSEHSKKVKRTLSAQLARKPVNKLDRYEKLPQVCAGNTGVVYCSRPEKKHKTKRRVMPLYLFKTEHAEGEEEDPQSSQGMHGESVHTEDLTDFEFASQSEQQSVFPAPKTAAAKQEDDEGEAVLEIVVPLPDTTVQAVENSRQARLAAFESSVPGNYSQALGHQHMTSSPLQEVPSQNKMLAPVVTTAEDVLQKESKKKKKKHKKKRRKSKQQMEAQKAFIVKNLQKHVRRDRKFMELANQKKKKFKQAKRLSTDDVHTT